MSFVISVMHTVPAGQPRRIAFEKRRLRSSTSQRIWLAGTGWINSCAAPEVFMEGAVVFTPENYVHIKKKKKHLKVIT